jgi:hypothetical protein
MSRGIIYPAYGYTPTAALMIGRVAGVSKPRPPAPIDSEGEPTAAMVAAFRADTDEVAAGPARSGAIARATVIDQTDTARFHRRATVENPFERLIEARLHLGLGRPPA